MSLFNSMPSEDLGHGHLKKPFYTVESFYCPGPNNLQITAIEQVRKTMSFTEKTKRRVSDQKI